jgi:hypothetical protein
MKRKLAKQESEVILIPADSLEPKPNPSLVSRDKIINMANDNLIEWFASSQMDYFSFKRAFLEFAELVAAAEREECAKLCNEVETQKPFGDHSWAALSCASAIINRQAKPFKDTQ